MTTYKAKTRTKMLTAEQELNLLDRYLDDGDMMAREKLITSYLPMATAAAQQVARRGNVPLEDLCQEAAIALVDHVPSAQSGVSWLYQKTETGALMRAAQM